MTYFLISIVLLISLVLFLISTRSILLSFYNIMIIDTAELLVNYIDDPKEAEVLLETLHGVIEGQGVSRKMNYHRFLMERLEELRPAPPSR